MNTEDTPKVRLNSALNSTITHFFQKQIGPVIAQSPFSGRCIGVTSGVSVAPFLFCHGHPTRKALH
jgi:hypothetical protein